MSINVTARTTERDLERVGGVHRYVEFVQAVVSNILKSQCQPLRAFFQSIRTQFVLDRILTSYHVFTIDLTYITFIR